MKCTVFGCDLPAGYCASHVDHYKKALVDIKKELERMFPKEYLQGQDDDGNLARFIYRVIREALEPIVPGRLT